MKNYLVTLYTEDNKDQIIDDITTYVYIKADSEDEAGHIANELYHNSDHSYYGFYEINEDEVDELN